MTGQMTEAEKPWAFPVALTRVDYHLVPDSPTNQEAEDYRAVTRQDDGTLLGIVSKDYELVLHKVLVNLCDAYFSDKNVTREVKLTKNGARMFLTYLMKDISIEIRPGDTVHPRVTITNSYDASLRIWVEAGAFRLVCSNGLTIGKKLMSKARKHIGTQSLDDIVAFLEQAENLLVNEIVPKWKEWVNVIVPQEQGVMIINSLKIPDKYKEQALIQWADTRSKSVWELYNSITFVLSHDTEDISIERQRTLEYAVADGFMEALMTTEVATT